MKAGFILECTPKGPDADIYPYVASRLCPTLTIVKPVTLGNKEGVMAEGALNASVLLESGCDYVFIVWDRMPKWGGTGRCADHVAHLEVELIREGVDLARVFLCCIDEMLESWLIADGRGVTTYFQGLTTHNVGIFPDHKKPSEQVNPKNKITRFNGKYNDYTDDFQIVKCLLDFNRVARWNASFGRFKTAIEQVCPN